jgi:hypothetical protein
VRSNLECESLLSLFPAKLASLNCEAHSIISPEHKLGLANYSKATQTDSLTRFVPHRPPPQGEATFD